MKRNNVDIYKKLYNNVRTTESSKPLINENNVSEEIDKGKIIEEIKKEENIVNEENNGIVEERKEENNLNIEEDIVKNEEIEKNSQETEMGEIKEKEKSKQKLEVILGIIVYNMALITSGYHTFRFYSFFEPKDLAIIALFITIAIEVSIFYFSYVYTKYKLLAPKIALYVFSFYIQVINFFIMEKNYSESILIFKTQDISFIIPFIASMFIPLISVFSSISVSKVMVENDNRNS